MAASSGPNYFARFLSFKKTIGIHGPFPGNRLVLLSRIFPTTTNNKDNMVKTKNCLLSNERNRRVCSVGPHESTRQRRKGIKKIITKCAVSGQWPHDSYNYLPSYTVMSPPPCRRLPTDVCDRRGRHLSDAACRHLSMTIVYNRPGQCVIIIVRHVPVP